MDLIINKNCNSNTEGDILLCLYCSNFIPFLSLKTSTNQTNILIDCSCLKVKQVMSIKEFVAKIKKRRTFNMPSPSLILPNIPYHKLCQHANRFSDYCRQCDIYICEQCTYDHNMMSIPNIDLSSIQNNMTIIDTIINTNKDAFNELVERIDKENNNNKLNLIKEQIQMCFNNNNSINEDLKYFYKCYYYTALFIQNQKLSSIYQLKFLQDSINITNNPFIIDNEDNVSIEAIYTKFKVYMENNYILNQVALKYLSTLPGNQKNIFCLIQLHDGRVVNSSEGKIRLWNMTTNQTITTVICHKKDIRCICQLKHGDILVSGSNDSTIKLWNVIGFKCIAILAGHKSCIYCLLQLKDGRLLSGSADNTIKIWNTLTFECLITLTDHKLYVHKLIQLDDDRFASFSYDQTIKFYNPNTLQCMSTLKTKGKYAYDILQLKDGRLVTCAKDLMIRIWSTASFKCLATLNGHSDYVYIILQLHNGKLASGSSDKTIKIWNVNTYECLITVQQKRLPLSFFQLKDSRLLSSSYEDTITEWEV